MALDNKVVVITGGSSGIGAATADLALKKGAYVVIGARHEEELSEAVMNAYKPDNITYKVTDVTKLDDVKALVQFAKDKFGRVDIFYNNAGIMPNGPLKEGKTDFWQKAFNINVMGVLNGISASIPVMEQQGHGQILATDSVAGHKVSKNSGVYNGTKHAVRAIMEGLRQEEHDKGIKTGIISPGLVKTNLFDHMDNDEHRKDVLDEIDKKNRVLYPKDIANAVVYMMDQPDNVDINEIYVRPLAQNN